MIPAAWQDRRDTADGVSCTTRVDPRAPVFDGHYPGFPLLPGLALIDLAQAAIRSTVGRASARVSAVDRVRFRKEVRPGDVLVLDVRFSEEQRCVVAVSTESGPVADLRLRYVVEERVGGAA